MGIFSRRPKIPDPTVSCSWTNTPNCPYRPGSVVSGTISFTCPAARQVRLATTSFHGHCITHNTRTESSGPNNQTRTIHYHDDVELYRYNQDLLSSRGLTIGGLAAIENEQYTFDFGFNFPSTTSNLRGEEFYMRSTAGSDAYDIAQHDLPPSYGLNYSDSKVADVVYRIEVAFLLDDNPEPFVVQFDPLSFTPYPPNPPPPHASAFLEFTRKTETYSSSRLAGQEKSFRASIKDKFSSHTPSIDLTMKASLIPFLTSGQPFKLFICVEVGRLSDPNAIQLPSVVLRVKKVKLYENTKFRALRVSRGHRRPENERMEERETALNAVPELQVVEQQPAPEPPPGYQPPQIFSDEKKEAKGRPRSSSSSSLQSTAHNGSSQPQLIFPTTFEARIPRDIVPSFRTVNINHHFQLNVEIEVEIAGKEFEHKFAVGYVTVLPSAV